MSAAGKSMHPLDRPIWSALTTRRQALAEGGALALRYLSHANRALRGHGGYVGAELCGAWRDHVRIRDSRTVSWAQISQ